MKSKQVKSKKRVADHGEVFTSEREVNAMLDLVKQETERIESRFLEPACGTGNFLAEILNRKLAVTDKRYKSAQTEWEFYAILAVSSIYGIDILEDNVIECRERLLRIFAERYGQNFGGKCNPQCLNVASFILKRNILWGDALSLKTPDVLAEPIVFSEWSPVSDNCLKRRDFTMANLLESQPMNEPNLFSDLGEMAFLPTPVAEFPVVHFMKLGVEDGF